MKPFTRSVVSLLSCAVLGLLAPTSVRASDAKPAAQGHDKAAGAGKEAAHAAGAKAPKGGREAGSGHGKGAEPSPLKSAHALVDPMDALRDKLAQKLGATKVPEAPSPYVVRVVAKSSDTHGADAKPAPAKAAANHTAGLVAKLRAEKGGGHGSAGKGDHAGAHWAYGGNGGPENWGALKPEFAKCANGSRQSPIDIRSAVKVDLEPIQFDYRPGTFRVVDNGHTVQINLGYGSAIEVMGRRYDLVQFHFHRPSEERIDGRQFDMSLHLVHRDPEGRLAVVGVLLERGSVHPVMQTVWANLPLEKGDEVAAQVMLDPSHLLPADRRYFTYMGSLTTPPCSEGVLWMVMQQPVPVSQDQVAVFTRLYPMNARPVQSAAGRLIKGSN